jgi:hypothetical protein
MLFCLVLIFPGQVFSYVLVSANIETFFPEKSTLVGLILIVIMCLAGAATLGYSLAMIIMFQSQMETLTPVLDLRRLVITAAMVLFSLILEASLVLTLVNVKRAVDLPKNAVSRAVIFLVAGSLLLAGWGISVAMTALYYFVDVTTYSVAMISVISFSELFTAICICLYSFFAAQIVTTKRPSAEKARQSLVRNSIHGSSLKEESVPLMYQNY